MSAPVLYTLTGGGLFVIGLHALILKPHLLRKILALNVMGSGVFMVLASVIPGEQPDPVPAALVITGIVIAVATTALALTLMLRVQQTTGRPELPAGASGGTDSRRCDDDSAEA